MLMFQPKKLSEEPCLSFVIDSCSLGRLAHALACRLPQSAEICHSTEASWISHDGGVLWKGKELVVALASRINLPRGGMNVRGT